MSARSDRLYGLEPLLAGPALFMACVAALTLPLSVIPGLGDERVLRPLAVVTAGLAVIIFLRLTFSPAVHRAVREANAAMNPRGPFLGPWRGWNDPEWGWKGSKQGTGLIVPLRMVLLVEWLITLVFARSLSPWLVLLMFAGCMLVILMNLARLRDHFPRPE